MLFKLTGSSCSGKSTAASLAGEGVERLAVHDFDEIGVPAHPDVVWRQRNLEAWVLRALEYQADDVDLLLTGQSPLGELLASPSAPQLNGIAVCLLEVADRDRFIRLEQRDPGRWDDDAKRAFAGWARWHRDHAADPQNRQAVIIAGGWDEMCWQRWTSWSRDDPRWHTTVLDTTNRSVEATASQLRGWMIRSRSAQAAGHLPLAPGWATPSVPR